MTDLSILKELFRKDALVEINHRDVILIEPTATEIQIKIIDLSIASVVIKIDDSFAAPSKFFECSAERGQCKRADYVIIDTNRKYIVYIELKAGNSSTVCSIKHQLMGAECFVKYCQSIVKSFWNCKDFLDDYQSRFVAMTNTGSNKKTKDNYSDLNNHTNDSVDNLLKIMGGTEHHFNKLVCSRQR